MITLSLEEVSQFAHVGWGYLLVTAPVLALGEKALLPWALIVTTAAGLKEYEDCHGLESEADSGGVSGSWLDFSMWCVGILAGSLTLVAHFAKFGR